ncbi:hypothetical protein AYY18_17500 [Morganella psychrotolerans]|uniref:Uncharacterized protein n=1 Tax=Morganella psychrotolerans TaxID=368603 RepID=A0A1B8HRA7_9GAMM|nr:hypothetical protein AYY18_17500 [Morganella psychrotolerans]
MLIFKPKSYIFARNATGTGDFSANRKKIEISPCGQTETPYNAPSLTRNNTLTSAPTVEKSEKS